ncbi:TetR/AcrR family transcriptional regulator [Rhodococcus sp. BP-149]|uniref:TetR/AcrR family transcriptional regulator n=1 Tax=unclassified Rhodococcus (in: high G+C Gram-positive bacteria) TaxID=192944 RepID=UPI001C9B3137|nr:MULTISPECIES: TetR/AcrR family transcriptional regulator [unclassified Rhodococcus (in: high G+C Gram-positive bacteria)]MBY6686170.1 TetR/AcrR family transcriptional regulator [Rhodococcus sp. BP-288]MBY6693740.1 TetR/AcrR family transcriptional regulator [Rhodococcus sp. BP-188]MBY6699663.1 TetR/AcrR family transcriptional regulator [Rhodococcus sp. BP-285]MBY6703992.1 TetR/AcrR family transcriptional regulator [Rhodococcus sp. BP-283]MBY6710859.1 TetR/AcrR family transcriptional regulato
MRSTATDRDLTARARIRDAAIDVFVSDGFGAPIRTIAVRAGVSPGLVIHHFTNKAGLRAECDAHVLDSTRNRTGRILGADGSDSSGGAVGDAVNETLQSMAEHGPLLVYVTRLMAEGGDSARTFVDRLVDDVESSMRAAVAAGTVRASVDEAARARYLVTMALGTLTIDMAMNPPPDPSDGAAILRAYSDRTMVPAAEYATHGLLTDNSALDAVLAAHAAGSPLDGTGDSRS